MNKTKILTISAITMALIAALLFFIPRNNEDHETYQQITSFLNTNPPAITTLRSILGDIETSSGSGETIVVAVVLDPGDFVDYEDDVVADGINAIDVYFGNFVAVNETFFIEVASSLREGLGFENLTLELIFDFEDFVMSWDFEAR